MKTVLFYSADKEKVRKIKSLCDDMSVGFTEIKYSEIGTELMVLLSEGKRKENSGKHNIIPPMYIMPELLIFRGFEGKDIDDFMVARKKEGIEKPPFMAVVTAYNISWTVFELVEELKKEKDYLEQ